MLNHVDPREILEPSLYLHTRLLVQSNVGHLLYWLPSGFTELAFRLSSEGASPFQFRLRTYFVPRYDVVQWHRGDVPRVLYLEPLIRRYRVPLSQLIYRLANSGATNRVSPEELEWWRECLGPGSWETGLMSTSVTEVWRRGELKPVIKRSSW